MKNFRINCIKIATLVTSLIAVNTAPAQTFTKILNGPVVNNAGDSRSVNWVDVNNDGNLDLFISNGKAGGQNNTLFLRSNQNALNFVEVANDPIVTDNSPSDGATFADTDNDGDLDAFVVNWYNQPNMFYTNDGYGNFTQDTSVPMTNSGGYSETASFGDYDNDGLVDVYVTRSGPTTITRRNQLYHNDGNNNFTKINTGLPVTQTFLSRSVNWTDMDNDGDLDLFVTNEGGSTDSNENIYRNDGNGTFTAITTGPLVNNFRATMSSSWADYDNDGDLDVYLANNQNNNALFRNDGNFNFTKITNNPVVDANSSSFSSAWSDIDNDGDLDLFVTNSYNSVAALLNNFLFINNGNGSFTKVQTGAIATDMSWSFGCAFGDYDNDGFQDLAVATVAFNGVDTNNFLYHNDGNANNWITIKLNGTTTNKTAIGTKIRVKANINGVDVWQMREISAQSSYCGQNDLRAHFGLGNATTIETIQVEWLNEATETYSAVNANQFISITQGVGILGLNEKPETRKAIIYPNPVIDFLNIKLYTNQEVCTVSVFNALGQLVLNLPDYQTNKSIDVSHLESGNYFIKIESDDITGNFKLIKY